VSNNIDPYTGIRRKCFALWKNQFDIQVNENGSKTMNNKNQKIIHRWDYGRAKPTWTTQSSKNISKVLDHLKLGLNDETTPDSSK
jgi:SMC interacting uncharacterized protein involved in chromosome segregation